MLREPQNKAFRVFLNSALLNMFTGTQQKTVLLRFVYLFGVKNVSASDVNGNRNVGQ